MGDAIKGMLPMGDELAAYWGERLPDGAEFGAYGPELLAKRDYEMAQGEWSKEPDRIEWRDRRSVPVLPCVIARNPIGSLCGYVAVPPGHPWHGLGFDDVAADVHGGITYCEPCHESGAVCHAPQRGESDDVWWVGFDCAHLYDYSPACGREMFATTVYRDVYYVMSEVGRLANQVRAAVKGDS